MECLEENRNAEGFGGECRAQLVDVGQDQRDAALRHDADERRHEFNAGFVQPMNVLDDDHRGRADAVPDEAADQIDETAVPRLGVDPRCVAVDPRSGEWWLEGLSLVLVSTRPLHPAPARQME